MTEAQKKMITMTLQQIEKDNTEIMEFLYSHTEPEQKVEEIEDNALKVICQAIVKWYAEMGEYWCDDYPRIIHNSLWATCIRAAIIKFNEHRYTIDDDELAIVNGNF